MHGYYHKRTCMVTCMIIIMHIFNYIVMATVCKCMFIIHMYVHITSLCILHTQYNYTEVTLYIKFTIIIFIDFYDHAYEIQISASLNMS